MPITQCEKLLQTQKAKTDGTIPLQQCESLLKNQKAKTDRLRDGSCMAVQNELDHLWLAFAEVELEAAKCRPDRLMYARKQIQALPPPLQNTVTHQARCAVQRPDGSCAEWAL